MAMEAPWRRDEHLATCFIFGGKLIVFCSTQLRGVALWGQTGNLLSKRARCMVRTYPTDDQYKHIAYCTSYSSLYVLRIYSLP